MAFDYDLITETGGTPITDEAASMVYTRYVVASDLARGRRTLEIGCASGVGLGLLGRTASSVVGGDINLNMLLSAHQHYGDRAALAQFSATALPFSGSSFGFILFLEATYYIREFSAALDEMDRVLAPDGIILFVNANPERPDFIRSPYSEHYHTAEEFRMLLEARGYQVQTAAAFALTPSPEIGHLKLIGARVAPAARRWAERLRLIPRTLKGRARIKRLMFEKLRTLPPELPENFAPSEKLMPISDYPVERYKVIYVIAERLAQPVHDVSLA